MTRTLDLQYFQTAQTNFILINIAISERTGNLMISQNGILCRFEVEFCEISRNALQQIVDNQSRILLKFSAGNNFK